MKKNLYDILGINKDADPKTIKETYRNKSKQIHPDKPGGDKEKFQELAFAYKVLGDEKTRKRYDATGQTENRRMDQIFMEFMNSLVFPVIEYIQQVDSTNIIKEVNKNVGVMMSNIKAEIQKGEKEIAKLDKILGRLRPTTDKGTFEGALNNRKEMTQNTINQNKEQLDEIKSCLEIINEYGYDFDKPKPTTVPVYKEFMTIEMQRAFKL